MSIEVHGQLRQQQGPHTDGTFGLGLIGPDFRYLFANSALAAISGLTPADFVGRTVREVQIDWADVLEPLLVTVLETGEPIPEFVVGRPHLATGLHDRSWRGRLGLLQVPSGAPLGITLVIEPLQVDGCMHARSVGPDDERRARTYGPLEMLAHDYKNRLAPILSAAQMLQRYGAQKPEVVDWAGVSIERQVRRMNDELVELIDLAQLMLGKIELRMQQVDLRPILERVSEAGFELTAKESKVLRGDFAQETFVVFGDPARLEQALRLVLCHVIESTPPEGTIEFSAVLDAGQVAIRVGNSNPGARDEPAGSRFEPFFDPQASQFTKPQSIGPGVALANNLILRHGGAFSASPRGRAQGRVLVIRIPALPVDQYRT